MRGSSVIGLRPGLRTRRGLTSSIKAIPHILSAFPGYPYSVRRT